MTNIQKEVRVLSGYKTYLVAVVTAVLGLANVFKVHHFDVTNVSAFVAGGGLSALRAAVAKVETAIKAVK